MVNWRGFIRDNLVTIVVILVIVALVGYTVTMFILSENLLKDLEGTP